MITDKRHGSHVRLGSLLLLTGFMGQENKQHKSSMRVSKAVTSSSCHPTPCLSSRLSVNETQCHKSCNLVII